MEAFSAVGDLLLRRYVVDFIGQMQQLSAPLGSNFKIASPPKEFRCTKCAGGGFSMEMCQYCADTKLRVMPLGEMNIGH